MTTDDVASRIAARYPSGFLRAYVRSKLRIDPVYAAVFERLSDNTEPLLDVGCGAGVLAAYLRARGFAAPIRGIDHDERKIAVAAAVVHDATFAVADARSAIAAGGTVVLLDLLHYFRSSDQAAILAAAANAKTVIIRDAVRDGSWRYRLTYAQETFSRAVRWLRAERLHFLTREEIVRPFAAFQAEVVPLYGRTPFNNYLFVFRRSNPGITNE
ncbi:MAG: class I SAM-dependent methyltransferase [Acidobacteria bacterium]|nr:class I SAM-dependent methyltransferase [Acidobacteriota bacterium]MBV9187257.1 class I SAM-dependent methyltransferase [Acidobacteriota bacterium]